ncbi:unnamed protein product, partial [Polarella glacialis]
KESSSVWFRELHEDASEEEMRSLCKAFGVVQDFTWHQGPGESSHKNSCSISFGSWCEALDAMEGLVGPSRSESLKEKLANLRASLSVHKDLPLGSWKPSLGLPVPPQPVDPGESGPVGRRSPSRPSSQPPTREPSAGGRRAVSRSRLSSDYGAEAEFERMKACYIAALDGPGSAQACTDLHFRLLALREALPPSAFSMEAVGVSGKPVGAAPDAANEREAPRATSRANSRANSRGPRGDRPKEAKGRAASLGLILGGLSKEFGEEDMASLIDHLKLDEK